VTAALESIFPSTNILSSFKTHSVTQQGIGGGPIGFPSWAGGGGGGG